jgi:diadenosine tetraphosphate (Ap4A) HIT family hydrolase
MVTNEENIIFESLSFTIERSPNPFVSREEGGHIRIFPKNHKVTCINDLAPKEAIELIRLEMVVREAMMEGMNQQGVKVAWVNLEDLGNWAFKRKETPRLHIHFFGRASTATKQLWPEAVYLPDRSSGFYNGFLPLTDEDMKLIGHLIEKKLKEQKYSDSNWKI